MMELWFQVVEQGEKEGNRVSIGDVKWCSGCKIKRTHHMGTG